MAVVKKLCRKGDTVHHLILFVLLATTTQLNAGEYRFDGRAVPLQPFRDLPEREKERSGGLSLSGLPEQVDLRAGQTPVKDQGDRGSCAYFAVTALMESGMKAWYADGRDPNLSEEYLIWWNKAVDGVSSGGDGSVTIENIRSLQRGGLLAEEYLPYHHSWFSPGMPCARWKSDDRTAPARCWAHQGPAKSVRQNVTGPEDFDAGFYGVAAVSESIVHELAAGQAVTLSLPVNQNGWNAVTGEAVHTSALQEECRGDKNLCGGHVVLITGYDLNRRVFTFKNSWGSSWGDGGYGFLSFDYVDVWSHNGGSYGVTVTHLPEQDYRPLKVTLDQPQIEVEVVDQPGPDGRSGVLVHLDFEYKAPVGSFYYVSLFAQWQLLDEAGEVMWQPILHADDYLADRHYRIIRGEADRLRRGENRVSPFLPREQFPDDDRELWLRPSVYSMSDQEAYGLLYRDYVPVELTTLQ